MTALWDDPRPKGYWPGTPTQWREPTIDDCAWYAVEFLFEKASNTHLSLHPVLDIRAYSSDKVGGTPNTVALRDTLRLWPASEDVTYRYNGYNRADIVDALRHGAGILWGGDYENLPVHYRRWTNNDVFAHAMASLTLDVNKAGKERTFLYDPLGGGPTKQPYDGEWITIDALLDFSWNSGKLYPIGIVENEGETVKYLHLGKGQKPDREVGVRRGGVARAAPRFSAGTVRKFWNADKRWPFLAKFKDGWFLVLWDQGENNWEFGYVHKDDIIANEGVVVETTTDPTIDELMRAITALKDDKQTLVDANYVQSQLLTQYEEVVPRVRDDLTTLP